jgi:hypothetical protein
LPFSFRCGYSLRFPQRYIYNPYLWYCV